MTEDHRELARNGRRVQPSNVSVPTEVRFDHQEKGRRDMYCFAVTAAGWHMGALAIDLEVCEHSVAIEVLLHAHFRQTRKKRTIVARAWRAILILRHLRPRRLFLHQVVCLPSLEEAFGLASPGGDC